MARQRDARRITRTSWKSVKLTDPQVRYIKTVLAEGKRYMKARGMKREVPYVGAHSGKGGMLTRLAKQFGVSKWTIYRIKTGERHGKVKVNSLKEIVSQPSFAITRMAPAAPQPKEIEPTSLEIVRDVMKDGKWRTLREIKLAVPECSEASLAARVRDLRKPEYGGHQIERERIGRTVKHRYRMVQ